MRPASSPLSIRILVALCFGLAGAASASPDPAAAGNYEFLAAPQTDLNRVFRLDRATGEVGACQYGLREGTTIGVTLCYPPGEGAKAGSVQRICAGRLPPHRRGRRVPGRSALRADVDLFRLERKRRRLHAAGEVSGAAALGVWPKWGVLNVS